MKSWLSIILSSLILAGGAVSVYVLNDKWNDPVVEASSALGKPGAVVKTSAAKPDLKTVIQGDQKKVVAVEVTTYEGKATGSGFIYNSKGDIVTNAHVVADAQGIKVKASDGSLYTGKLIGVNPEKDIALIRADGLSGREPLEIDAGAKIDIGDEVIAFGSPLGLDNTVTTGIISGLNRDFDIEETSYKGLYQISAPITHGNSGGPLVLKSSGKVIGINSAGEEQGSIGFSIPIGQAKAMIEDWSQHPDSKLAADTAGSGDALDEGEFTKETMSSGAEYTVRSFYEALGSKDYVTAYSLLGSDWQTKTSYEAFRKGYLYTLAVSVTRVTVTSADSQSAQLTAVIEAYEDKKSGDTVISTYSVKYTIKPENGVLKIITGKGKKL
ncbi:trypsin-like serine protease [Paenibacillus rhizovicinus]|uniref:Trypsin-like serine protease n=1 Tax=Paenibacillus rhizovicinus TaxID=2704463 RepID=A0A6C0P7Y1_9BACL|nr:trypsin-like peptidase domain-containing protein [Paenibacillus rhizovicinus]QHW34664.1 trypsin-like serine protease [Paenibacillus rhizovicinus]